jgi:predicted dehydrogenase/nucleoside-diphosphate-sugar epimerase
MSRGALENRYRVGIIGAGYVSSYHLRALRTLKHIDVVGITDLNHRKAEKVASAFRTPFVKSTEELYATRPDVVHILTPPSSHCALTLEALDMGCHVLVEKPMAVSEEECELMIKKAAAVARTISVNHSAKFDPAILRSLKLVGENAIGDVLTIDYFRSSEYPAYRGGPVPEPFRDGGYPFRDLGVHALYLAEAFLGRIRDVETVCLNTGKHAQLVFDEWRSLIHCEKGVGQAHLSWSVRPIEHTLFIQGSRGAIFLDLYLETCVIHKHLPIPKPVGASINAVGSAVRSVSQSFSNSLKLAIGSMHRSPDIHRAVREFHLALASGKTPPVSAEEGKRMVAWVERSARLADTQKRRLIAPAVLKCAAVLVTGATGFLGRALVDALLGTGKHIPVLTHRHVPTEFVNNPSIEVVRGDLGDSELVERVVQNVEVVYHAGSATNGSWAEYESGTIEGTKNVVESCLRQSVKRLVHVSSLSVLRYADLRQQISLDETAGLEPFPEKRGYYAHAKLRAENIVLRAVKEHGLNAVVIRPGTIFGPGAERVPPYGVFAVGKRWFVMGSANRLLPLVYIDDAVDALIRAAECERARGQILNLVDPEKLAQREYLRCVRRSIPEIHQYRVPMSILYAAAVPVEALGRILGSSVPLTRYRLRSIKSHTQFDCAVVRNMLGWVPRVGVREGLRRTFGQGPLPHQQRLPALSGPGATVATQSSACSAQGSIAPRGNANHAPGGR